MYLKQSIVMVSADVDAMWFLVKKYQYKKTFWVVYHKWQESHNFKRKWFMTLLWYLSIFIIN